ncbi:MAG: LON peptidase substrate-binding domain-containing protein [Bacteroidales bacterium]|nr:LON peptidase substrate-binding domain-containing protein [Bacteroidales bacterium]
MNDTERKIAFFPLNVFLLPGEDLPLRIFEPRYKQLINDCEENKMTFGIPYMMNRQIQSFGTEVLISQIIAKNSQGEMVIMVEGVSNFEMISFHDPASGKLYANGKVKDLKSDREICDNELLKMVIHYSENLDHEFLKNVKGNVIHLNDVAVALNLSSDDKYKYISIKGLSEREKFLKAQMMILLKLCEQEKLLNNDYYLN